MIISNVPAKPVTINKLFEGVVPPVDEATVQGEEQSIEATWVNPHKNVSSEYNRKIYIKELAKNSAYANYTASAWEGYQDVPHEVYTMAGAKFPQHFPDVKGNTSHSIAYLSEALFKLFTKAGSSANHIGHLK